jgi:hypothetical protein
MVISGDNADTPPVVSLDFLAKTVPACCLPAAPVSKIEG